MAGELTVQNTLRHSETSAPATLIPLPASEIAVTKSYIDRARSDATTRKYAKDWIAFSAWCTERSQPNLPAAPTTVATYLGTEAKRKLEPSTLTRKLAAISHYHRLAGYDPPHKTSGGTVVLTTLAGIRRSRTTPVAKKRAAVSDIMLVVLSHIGEHSTELADLRDRALLSFGMASAMRRSELVALDVADLAFEDGGVQVTIRRSKTDQEGNSVVIAVPDGMRLRPVHALRIWLHQTGITEGAVFRQLSSNGKRLLPERLSGRGVARVVQARFAKAGYDPKQFAAHSLRSGFLTSAASVWKMREVSRHKSVQVLADYVQSAGLLNDHAGEGFL